MAIYSVPDCAAPWRMKHGMAMKRHRPTGRLDKVGTRTGGCMTRITSIVVSFMPRRRFSMLRDLSISTGRRQLHSGTQIITAHQFLWTSFKFHDLESLILSSQNGPGSRTLFLYHTIIFKTLHFLYENCQNGSHLCRRSSHL